MNPHIVTLLRRGFQVFNRFMLLLWRLDMAWWFTLAPRYTGQVMILHHTGRKSGLARRTPLNYALVNHELYCTAGFGQVTHWYANILANPSVKVWLPDGCWTGVAEDISENPDALNLLRQVLIGSGFAAFAAGINPYRMSDEALAAATRDYRVIHIRRTAEVAGQADLRWVWQIATMVLLSLFLARVRRKK